MKTKTEEKAMVKFGDTPITTAMTVKPEDMAEFFPEDLPQILPLWKIDKDVGKFFNTGTEEHAEEINFVIFGARMSRVLYPETYGDTNSPSWICRAIDGKHGNLNYENLDPDASRNLELRNIGAACAICPMKDWLDGKPPRCTHVLSLGCIDADSKAEFMFNASRSAMKPTSKHLNKFKLMKIIPYALVTRARLIKKEEGKPVKRWYVPEFEVMGATVEYPGCENLVSEIDARRKTALAARFQASAEVEPERPATTGGDLDIEDIG